MITQNSKNVMCCIYEVYCNSGRREHLLNFASEPFNLSCQDAAFVIKELKTEGYISKVEKMGQTYYKFYIEDAMIEHYEQ